MSAVQGWHSTNFVGNARRTPGRDEPRGLTSKQMNDPALSRFANSRRGNRSAAWPCFPDRSGFGPGRCASPVGASVDRRKPRPVGFGTPSHLTRSRFATRRRCRAFSPRGDPLGLESEKHVRRHLPTAIGIMETRARCTIARWEWPMRVVPLGARQDSSTSVHRPVAGERVGLHIPYTPMITGFGILRFAASDQRLRGYRRKTQRG